jgi:hypothetical protein
MFRMTISLGVALLLGASVAKAQENALPVAAPAPPPVASTPPPSTSDHDALVHHLAVGYFGASQLPIGVPPSGPGAPPTGGTVTAPAIGVRYWFSRRYGLDAAIGLGFSSGSDTVTGPGTSATASAPTSFGMDFHGGLPIAVASVSHYVFEVIPEALVGFTTGSIPGAPTQHISGFVANLGGRAGAELHFGFIGIPQLSLQATIGLYYNHTSFGWSQGASSGSVQANAISTSVQAAPWAVFVNNISALYYF